MAAVCAALLACACFAQAPAKKGQPNVKKQSYGKMPDGTPVDLYLLTNAKRHGGPPGRVRRHAGIADGARPPRRVRRRRAGHGTPWTAAARQAATSAPSSAVTAIASAAQSSRWRARPIACPSTMAPHRSTAARSGFGKQLWQVREVASAEGPAVEFTYVAKMARKLPRHFDQQGGLHADE